MIAELTKVKDSYNCDALAIAGATAAIDDQALAAGEPAADDCHAPALERGMAELGFSVQPSQANFVWCTARVESL